MRLNQATDYAFRAVLYLSRIPENALVEAQAIARNEQIPMRFLLKLMRMLIKAGIVRSSRGAGGGYALARPAAKISLLDVVEAVEGPVSINRCLIDPAYCSKKWAAHCSIHRILDNIQTGMVQELSRHTFAELVQLEREQKPPVGNAGS